MDSLKDILNNKKSFNQPQMTIERLKTYIVKKYDFSPNINLTTYYITIYVSNSSQATTLRLDWSNLNQLINYSYKLRISLRQPR